MNKEESQGPKGPHGPVATDALVMERHRGSVGKAALQQAAQHLLDLGRALEEQLGGSGQELKQRKHDTRTQTNTPDVNTSEENTSTGGEREEHAPSRTARTCANTEQTHSH